MSFVVEKVKQLACAECGRELDTAPIQPLAFIACPDCGNEQVVPAEFDNYLVYEKLGKGNFGVVFRGKDKGLGRDFAIKIFKADDKRGEEIAATALSEAKALAQLNHHNVVRVHTLGQHQGAHYIVMELLDGGSAERYCEPGQQPTELEGLQLGMCIAKGLRMAQRVGLIHMDVKPGNMLYDREGHPKLIDFGMSGRAKPNREEGVVGTPYYIAPETALGREPDFRADMYSLGASLFHIMTGRPPFDHEDTRTTIGLRLKHAAPSMLEYRSDLHAKSVAVVARLLEREPAHRFDSYDDLIDAFDKAKLQVEFGVDADDDTPPVAAPAVPVVAAPPPSPPIAAAPPTSPRQSETAQGTSAIVMLVAFLALVVVLGGVGWLMFGGGETGEVVSPRSSMDSVEQRPRSESAAPVTSPASPARPTISVSDAAASPAPIGAPPPSAGNAPVDATPPLQPSAASGVDAIPGLIARWTFDERGSNRVADSANGFASGVFLGEPGWLAPGRVGAAAGRFDGESYVVFEDAMPRGAYTKAAWVHRYTGDHDQPIFAGATGHALMISFRHGFRAVAGHNGRWDAVASPDPIPALRWHHIAVTYDPKIDGGRLTLFVDGNEVGHAIDVAVPNPETEMFIGTLGRATRFRGLLDDVRLYDRALASDEIRRLAASL